eukprot:4601256-Karenia_brevis.AAC.1
MTPPHERAPVQGAATDSVAGTVVDEERGSDDSDESSSERSRSRSRTPSPKPVTQPVVKEEKQTAAQQEPESSDDNSSDTQSVASEGVRSAPAVLQGVCTQESKTRAVTDVWLVALD